MVVLDAAADLVLGGRCVACERPGRLLCSRCADALPCTAFPAWPRPAPPGLAPPWAAAAYEGAVRAMVLGHKERRLLGLARPLGGLLALAVGAAVRSAPPPAAPVVLVPVPSRVASVRARGHDPTRAVTLRAARALGAAAGDVLVVPLLRLRPGVVDQSGLDAARRAANLAGSMTCPASSLRRLRARRTRARVVICDDVLTTGSTAREAQRALEAVGLEVLAVAAIAATERHPGVPHPEHSEFSAERLSPRGATH